MVTTEKGIITHTCITGEACSFPYCERDMKCIRHKKEKDDVEPIKKLDQENKKEANKVTSVNQYFNYQKEINMIEYKINKLREAQKEIYENIETDVRTVFLSADFHDEFKVELKPNMIKIFLYLKKYNDYKIVHPIDIQLFRSLDELMGRSGELNSTRDNL